MGFDELKYVGITSYSTLQKYSFLLNMFTFCYNHELYCNAIFIHRHNTICVRWKEVDKWF